MEYSLLLILFIGMCLFIGGFFLVKLFSIINTIQTMLIHHTHAKTSILPSITLNSNDAVFEYDPRTSHMALYFAIFRYFEKIHNTNKSWRYFSYLSRKNKMNQFDNTFPVGAHRFQFSNNSCTLMFLVYEPVFEERSGSFRHPLRILVRGPNAAKQLHEVMDTIRVQYLDAVMYKSSALLTSPSRIIQFKKGR